MTDDTAQSEKLLTLQELCDLKIIPVGKRTIVKFLESGELPAANFKPEGGALNLWRIKLSDARKFVRNRFQHN